MLRFDRIITLFFSALGIHKKLTSYSKIPILMYHSIVTDKVSHLDPFFSTETTESRFEEQMASLQKNKYKTVTMSEIVNKGFKTDQQLCVITFDDGFEDFFANAFPILNRYGFSSTVYIPTKKVGLRSGLDGKPHLTWEQIRHLDAEGIEFGSHTVNHPQLYSCGRQQVIEEMKISKADLEQHLGHTVSSFAYPYAFPEQDFDFAANLVRILENLQYQSNVTTIIGTASSNTHHFIVPRIPVNDWDDPKFFLSKLRGVYDWMHMVQLVKKRILSIRK